MKKIDWVSKLSSRKFWVTIAGLVVSIEALFGVSSAVQVKVAALLTAFGTAIIYVLSEAAIDHANVGQVSTSDQGESKVEDQPSDAVSNDQ